MKIDERERKRERERFVLNMDQWGQNAHKNTLQMSCKQPIAFQFDWKEFYGSSLPSLPYSIGYLHCYQTIMQPSTKHQEFSTMYTDNKSINNYYELEHLLRSRDKINDVETANSPRYSTIKWVLVFALLYDNNKKKTLHISTLDTNDDDDVAINNSKLGVKLHCKNNGEHSVLGWSHVSYLIP